MNKQATVNDILDFWFNNQSQWFNSNDKFDNDILKMFSNIYNQALENKLDEWKNEPLSILALIILTDQFPRNMFRNNKKMYGSDDIALSLTKEAIGKQFDQHLNEAQKRFLYMPLMHSEEIEDQLLSVKLFKTIDPESPYAQMHYDIVKDFGRFPHRNKILGRVSSVEELEFLKTPNSSF